MEEKIAAIYALRDAADAHARLEAALGDDPTVAARHALLDSRLHLEEKTQAAIEACVQGSSPRSDDAPPGGKVIQGNFGRTQSTPKEAES